jgi:hypothetical protein
MKQNTLRWILVAVALFSFIFFYQRHVHKAPTGPLPILPRLHSAETTRVGIRRLGQPDIRAERTNGGWQLTEPLKYPAQALSIETLLANLEHLTPTALISPLELKRHPHAQEEYGFVSPQAIIFFEQGDYHGQLLLGAKTAPGDQVFFQVAGENEIYLVDAELLQSIPRTANDWRDTTLISLRGLAFDHLTVTNGAKILELARPSTNGLWRILVPNSTRADNAKIKQALQKLHSLLILQFVPEEPKPDLDAMGLQPAELEVALASGTNPVALLQFGKSPTNDPSQVFARRLGQNAIVTVAKDLLAPWRAPVDDFRDTHLLALTVPVGSIDVRGEDTFSLVRQTNGSWLVLAQNTSTNASFPADSESVTELLSSLSTMEIVRFEKDVVTEPDLPGYGLASPSRQYLLKLPPESLAAGSTNALIAEIQFGTNREDNVYARRTDETSVYAVKRADVERLPVASWQMRERQLWNLSETNVSKVTIQQQGKTRQLLHTGQYKWSLAPGSQGIIDGIPEEETVRGLCHLAVAGWSARGGENRAKFGFSDAGHQITIELKTGEKVNLQFGGLAPSGLSYASVNLDGQDWIFEFPLALYHHVQSYLTIPANVL